MRTAAVVPQPTFLITELSLSLPFSLSAFLSLCLSLSLSLSLQKPALVTKGSSPGLRRFTPPALRMVKTSKMTDTNTSTCSVHAFIDLILMDPCIVDYSIEIPTRCSFVIELIIPKFIEGSTCFERHTAHHQEL